MTQLEKPAAAAPGAALPPPTTPSRGYFWGDAWSIWAAAAGVYTNK